MLLIASAAIFFGLGTGVAAAAEVHFDPDGPAAKEYALPLDQAREEGAGAGESDGPAGEKAPLFGAGVAAGGSSGGSGLGGSGGGPGNGGGEGTATEGGTGAGQSGTSSAREQKAEAVANAAIADAGGYPLSSAVLWIAAFLALAAVLALGLRAGGRRARAT